MTLKLTPLIPIEIPFQKEYADKLSVSLPTVKRLFAKLQKDNVLVREGTNRKGYWKIIEK